MRHRAQEVALTVIEVTQVLSRPVYYFTHCNNHLPAPPALARCAGQFFALFVRAVCNALVQGFTFTGSDLIQASKSS
jgi:hypothetical protein